MVTHTVACFIEVVLVSAFVLLLTIRFVARVGVNFHIVDYPEPSGFPAKSPVDGSVSGSSLTLMDMIYGTLLQIPSRLHATICRKISLQTDRQTSDLNFAHVSER